MVARHWNAQVYSLAYLKESETTISFDWAILELEGQIAVHVVDSGCLFSTTDVLLKNDCYHSGEDAFQGTGCTFRFELATV